MTIQPRAIHLADYQPFTHRVEDVALTFRLSPRATRVQASLRLSPNPARPGSNDLRLDAEAIATRIAAAPDPAACTPSALAEAWARPR